MAFVGQQIVNLKGFVEWNTEPLHWYINIRVMALKGIEVDSDDDDILLVRTALPIYQNIFVVRFVKLEIIVFVKRRVFLANGRSK